MPYFLGVYLEVHSHNPIKLNDHIGFLDIDL